MRKIIYFISIIFIISAFYIGRIKLASIYHNKGVEFFNNDNFQQACEYFKKAVKIYPSSFQSHYELANTYSFLNRHRESIREYLKVLKIKKNSKVYCDLANEYLTLKEYDNASHIIQEALSLFPKDESLIKLRQVVSFQYALHLAKRAEEELDSGRILNAIELYQKTISINPCVFAVYLNLASLYIMTGQDKKAESLLMEYTKRNPQDAFAYKLLGDISLERNSYLMAIENYKRAIEVNPTYAEAYNGLALAYDYLGYYNSALEMIEKAHEFEPNNRFIIYNLGKIFRDNGKFQNALSAFLKLQEINPEFPYLNESLAEIYVLLNQTQKASSVLEQEIAQTKKDYEHNKDSTNLLKLVYLYFISKDYGIIKDLIQDAINEGRDFPELHYFYGKIWEDEGKLIEASRAYEKAMRSRFGTVAKERYYKIHSP